MQIFLVAFTLASLVLAGPIPSRKPGYNFGNQAAKSKIDLFVDPHCPASKAFFGVVTKALATKIDGVPLIEKVAVTYNIQPLPYHHHAFLALKLTKFLEVKYPDSIPKFLSIQFDKVDDYNTGGLNKSLNEAKQMLIQDAIQAIGKQDPTIAEAFTNDEYEIQARSAFKYAALKGVTGCPFFFVNSVRVEEVPASTGDLVKFLSQYI